MTTADMQAPEAAQAAPAQMDPSLTIQIPLSALNATLSALAELPYAKVNGLIEFLQQNGKAALEAFAAEMNAQAGAGAEGAEATPA